MKQKNTCKERFPLTSEGIDAASAQIGTVLEEVSNRRDGLRIQLAADEVMRFWGEVLGEDTSCTILYKLRQRSIRLSAPGVSADPNLSNENSEENSERETPGNFLLERLGIIPSFRYGKGVNLVTFRLSRKKPNQLALIGFAAVLAVLLGFISLSLPDEVRIFLTEGLAAPFLKMLMGALTGVAMPMIFFSICISIMDIGDIVTLGKLGKKLLTRFFVVMFAVTTLAVAAIVWLFPFSSGSSGGGVGFQSILAMVFSAVPSNIISPFLDGNTLQLIFLGVCFGVAFLLLGECVTGAADIFRQLDRLVGLLMGGINQLIPLFVFLTFFTLAASGNMSRLGGAIKIILLVTLLSSVLIILYTIAMSLHFHMSLPLLVRKIAPAFLVALTTASSIASYPIRLETCEKQLGIDTHTARFAVPLAQAIFKPGTCILFSVSALCVAEEYGVPITPVWLLLCVIVTALLTIATPSIPGGGKISYTALLLQLGIPVEGLMLILAADAVLDFVATATNAHAQVALMTICAGELDLLDQAILAAPIQSLK